MYIINIVNLTSRYYIILSENESTLVKFVLSVSYILCFILQGIFIV